MNLFEALCQNPQSRDAGRVPGAIHPRHRHQQLPHPAGGSRRGHLPLSGQPGERGRERDDFTGGGIHPAFPAARTAPSLYPHPALRPASQPGQSRAATGAGAVRFRRRAAGCGEAAPAGLAEELSGRRPEPVSALRPGADAHGAGIWAGYRLAQGRSAAVGRAGQGETGGHLRAGRGAAREREGGSGPGGREEAVFGKIRPFSGMTSGEKWFMMQGKQRQ